MWADSDGFVSQCDASGQIVRSRPARFGAITNAHRMQFGGPWDHTFEPAFGDADSQFPKLIQWLQSLRPTGAVGTADLEDRIVATKMSDAEQAILAKCLTSLIVRSPGTRQAIEAAIRGLLADTPSAGEKVDDSVVAVNQRNLIRSVERTLANGGKYAVLFSADEEFIFGDGFLHNFSIGNLIHWHARCVVPLHPSITVVFHRPERSPAEPRLVAVSVSREEVAALNELVEIYSGRFIYFRSARPKISEYFRQARFLQLQQHTCEWLDLFLDALARYRVDSIANTGSAGV